MLSKNIFFITAFFFLSILNSEAFQNVQVLVKGKITDEYTGAPLSVTIEFRNGNGKKFKIKSNSIDGKYEQVFNSGDKFEVILTNWDIAKKTDTLNVDNVTKYVELERNFSVKRFTPGLAAFKYNLFNPSQNSLIDYTKEKLNELQTIMQFNRNVKFEIVVNSHDTYSNPYIPVEIKTDDKKKKKSKEKKLEPKKEIIKYPDPADIKNLVDARYGIVSGIIDTWTRYKDRITLKADYSPAESPKHGFNISDNYDVIVIVKDIKNVFE